MHAEVLACLDGEAERTQMERVLEFALYQEIADQVSRQFQGLIE